MKRMRWLPAVMIGLFGVAGGAVAPLEAREIRGTPQEVREYQKKVRRAQKEAAKLEKERAKALREANKRPKKGRVEYGVKQRS